MKRLLAVEFISMEKQLRRIQHEHSYEKKFVWHDSDYLIKSENIFIRYEVKLLRFIVEVQ